MGRGRGKGRKGEGEREGREDGEGYVMVLGGWMPLRLRSLLSLPWSFLPSASQLHMRNTLETIITQQ